jgi:hypothetical protein
MLLLTLRLYHLWAKDDEDLFLFSEKTRAVHVLMLSILVFTGIYLGFNYDFDEGKWFVIKLLLLGFSAFIGDYTFKNYHKWGGLVLLLIMAYVIGISITKSLDLVYAY